MTDLSLVSLEDLMGEVESRCGEFVCAYTPIEFEKSKEFKFYYGKGSWHTSCALANILNNDVLNNWSGELRTLQRINEESKE